MEASNLVQAVVGVLTVLLISWQFGRAVWYVMWRPYAIARLFKRQGIQGPPYRLIVGSLPECRRLLISGRANALDAGCHNYASLVQPFFQKWASDYGKTFLFWFGPIPAICSTDIELVKQVLSDRTNLFQKDYLNPSMEAILGKGLIFVNGVDWRRHRKVVRPIFNHENLKCMSTMALRGTQEMMERWSTEIRKGNDNQAEIDMRHESEELTLGVIIGVIFGKNNKDAREVFYAGKKLQELAVYATFDPPIPGFRYLPTRRNTQLWQLNKFINRKIMQLIEARLGSGVYGEDLLGLMLQASRSTTKALSTHEIIGECKTFFAAGQDTSANLLTWAMYLLSSYPEWQQKVRAEVLGECDDSDVPSIEALGRMKLLNMSILETLRLYNPVVYIQRKTSSDTVLQNIEVPKGTMITIPIAMLHRDKEVWGPDADDFNPMRFVNGASTAAKHSNALLAFSNGPRVCAGQNFAMIEVQIVMVMILKRFSFSVSPRYIHKPTNFLTLKPRYGLPLILRNLKGGV